MPYDVNDTVVLLIPTAETNSKYDWCIEMLSPPVICFGDGSSNSTNSKYYLFDNYSITKTLYKERVGWGVELT